MRIESWSGSNIGLLRTSNQDAIGCFPELGVFIVADGMGGLAHGELASRLTVDTVRETIAAARTTQTPNPTNRHPRQDEDNLAAAVSLANRRVYEAGRSQPATPRGSVMGTTVVILECHPAQRRAAWCHVGDSRLYRVRDGNMALLTADHTQFGRPYWTSGDVPTDLRHTNRLDRAVGIGPTVEISAGADALRPDDLYLLCSDGISGMVAPAALDRVLAGAPALGEAGPTLIRLALDGGGRDNASVVLVRSLED